MAKNRKCEPASSVLARRQGTRVKHNLDGNSDKMYDKQGSVPQVETTLNKMRKFQVYHAVETDPRGAKDWTVISTVKVRRIVDPPCVVRG